MGDLRHLTDLHDLQDEAKRLNSFANWPRSAGAQPVALSRAGFYYTGERQRAACAFCQVVIDDWTFADQAIAKHRDRSPNCPFVLRAYDVVQHLPTSSSSSPSSSSTSSSSSSSSSSAPSSPTIFWESERRKTFEGWPITYVSPEDLARAGFVYLKHDDRVQCVFCHGIVGTWEEGDVPWMEHQRHFKSCPFVQRRSDVGNVSIEDEYRGHRVTAPRQGPGSGSGVARGDDMVGMRTPVPGFRPERSRSSTEVGVGRSSSSKDRVALTNGELNILHHSPAKNPNFKNKESRLRTYAGWPTSVQQDPETLADAGFFYTGLSDHVKCFHCSGGLRNWEPKDIPWQEHARWFPDCEYISLYKGKEFIEAASQQRPTFSQPTSATSSFIPKRNGSTSAIQVSEAELDELMRSDVVRQALDVNLEAHQIRAAVQRRMSHAGYPFADVESLVNAVLDLESKANGSRGESPGGSGGVRRSESLAELPVSRTADSEPNNTTASRNGTLRSATMDVDPRLCKICWDKDVCVVFLPCGHLVSCAECSSALKDCPFCRQEIKGTVRTYWP